MTTHAAPPSLSPGLVWLMSIATGLTVAANYYAQPLLHVIADDLGLSVPEAGSIVTAAQVSYAVGLFLLVPLGDLLDRRNLIFVMTLLAAGGLCASALAGNLPVLLAGTTVAGLFSVVAQVLVPFGATLAAPNERGKVVGTLMSGLLLGILLARTFAGLVAALGNWRLVYGIAAILMAALAFILRRSLPHHPAQAAGMAYPRLIASIAALFAQEPVLRTRAVLGALTFASFAMFWTSLAFLLSAPPFGYSTFTIGLFGLAGAAGALAAARVGRLADRGKGETATRFGLAVLLVSWLPIAFGQYSVALLLLGVILMDLGAQAAHISNQNAIYRIRPEARGRLTAAYMTSYFIGGSLGSLASAWLYAHAGWHGVSIGGAVAALASVAAWTMRPRGPAAAAPSTH
ncbi:MFS transporter [Pigmentiphaga sp.]|uniref:MFS transporter n=1 Tax=Pigmentiphaga sp. TaxID=1977564 RepID=UPI00128B4221|nr:MFS transporter [Pigmentiphaga sp.]MPS25728.1 MFS transporter [Alcaligenaceae bacterium SAGV5]MPS54454.1 MFS transporter [Alcaligenaceae bacterium SAGV3]MPT58594.1 MFS transporter [Alcaligenaceae bacterium]